jgi:hypothetical protein
MFFAFSVAVVAELIECFVLSVQAPLSMFPK